MNSALSKTNRVEFSIDSTTNLRGLIPSNLKSAPFTSESVRKNGLSLFSRCNAKSVNVDKCFLIETPDIVLIRRRSSMCGISSRQNNINEPRRPFPETKSQGCNKNNRQKLRSASIGFVPSHQENTFRSWQCCDRSRFNVSEESNGVSSVKPNSSNQGNQNLCTERNLMEKFEESSSIKISSKPKRSLFRKAPMVFEDAESKNMIQTSCDKNLLLQEFCKTKKNKDMPSTLDGLSRNEKLLLIMRNAVQYEKFTVALREERKKQMIPRNHLICMLVDEHFKELKQLEKAAIEPEVLAQKKKKKAQGKSVRCSQIAASSSQRRNVSTVRTKFINAASIVCKRGHLGYKLDHTVTDDEAILHDQLDVTDCTINRVFSQHVFGWDDADQVLPISQFKSKHKQIDNGTLTSLDENHWKSNLTVTAEPGIDDDTVSLSVDDSNYF